jgi:NTP pyrophosphatase (non-canonical NTP hydrolase)
MRETILEQVGRLQAMAEDDGGTWDLTENDRAACRAGGEALALRSGALHPLEVLMRRVHGNNARWWHNPATGERVERNVGELLMLVTSELGEALEGHRKGIADAHLPERPSFEVEIADAVIRLFDMAGGLGLDLAGAFEAKLAYNATRHDHTNAARLAAGGKKY